MKTTTLIAEEIANKVLDRLSPVFIVKTQLGNKVEVHEGILKELIAFEASTVLFENKEGK